MENRKSYRFNPEIPIQIELELGRNFIIPRDYLNNISPEGISFRFGFSIIPGRKIKINIPLDRSVFAINAEVVWCKPDGQEYNIGVKFKDPSDEFKARIFSQICLIEKYKQEVERLKAELEKSKS